MDPVIIGALLVALFVLILIGCVLFARRMAVDAPATVDTRRPIVLFQGLVVFAAIILMLLALVGFLVFNLYLGVVLFIALFVAVNVLSVRARRARQHGLLTVLASAARHRTPLGPAIRTFAGTRGPLARHAHRAAAAIENGVPVDEALVTGRLLPDRAKTLIIAGAEAGSLERGLTEAAAAIKPRAEWNRITVGIAYVVAFTFVATVLLFGLLIFVVPEYIMIYADFDLQLPRPTAALIEFVDSNLAPLTLFALLLAVLVIYLCVHSTLYASGYARSPVVGFRLLTRRLDTATILRALSMMAQSGKPLAAGFRSLADTYPVRSLRRRLERVAEETDQGAPWHARLLKHGVIHRAEAGVLAAAERTGNLPWALREMADSSERRFYYRMEAARSFALPIVVLLLGFLVFFVVVALFVPLVDLISWLA